MASPESYRSVCLQKRFGFRRCQDAFRFTSLLLISCSLSNTALAQSLDFSVSPRPVGSGARAAGMADAFVAIADDATAASWNPAGLVQLERPEFSIVGDWSRIVNAFSDATPVDNERDHRDTASNLNFVSFTYPLPVYFGSRNSVISVTYQNRFDLTRDFDVGLHTSIPAFSIESDLDLGFEQKGSLGAISPAYAIEITHSLSVGVAVNFWRSSFLSDNSWDQTQIIHTETTIGTDDPSTTDRITKDKYEDFEGENVTAGLLWNVAPKWNLALRYDSAFEGELKYKSSTTIRNSLFPNMITQSSSKESQKMSIPETWTLGVAYRHSDRLTLALQISRTDWNDFYLKDESGTKTSLVDGTDLDDPDTKTKFDPTHSIRFGVEYVFIPKKPDSDLKYLWSLRGGLIYDEEPASGRSSFAPNSQGRGKPDRFYGFALGAGLQAFQRVNFDVAYQLRYGDNVKSDLVRGLPGFHEDLLQQRIIFSSIIYF